MQKERRGKRRAQGLDGPRRRGRAEEGRGRRWRARADATTLVGRPVSLIYSCPTCISPSPRTPPAVNTPPDPRCPSRPSRLTAPTHQQLQQQQRGPPQRTKRYKRPAPEVLARAPACMGPRTNCAHLGVINLHTLKRSLMVIRAIIKAVAIQGQGDLPAIHYTGREGLELPRRARLSSL